MQLEVRGLEHLETIDAAGDLRRQPSEPLRHAGDPAGAAAALAVPGRAGDGEGVLQGAFLPGADSARRARLTNSMNYYLASAVLQRVPAAAAGSRHAPDAALHRRAGSAGILGPDLPGRATDRGRADRPFQPGVGDDRRPARRAGRAGPARGARPDPPPHLEVPGARAVRGSSSVRLCRLKGNDYAALAARGRRRPCGDLN